MRELAVGANVIVVFVDYDRAPEHRYPVAGEAYGRKLIGAGVEVLTTRYNTTIHDFEMLNSLLKAAGVLPTQIEVWTNRYLNNLIE